MPKTILLAIATLLLAVVALVTDLVRPYAGDIGSVRAPAQVQQMPDRAPLRVPVRHDFRDVAFISSNPLS